MNSPVQASALSSRILGSRLLVSAIASVAVTWWLADSFHTRGASLAGQASDLLLFAATALRIYLLPVLAVLATLAAANAYFVWMPRHTKPRNA